MRHLVLALLGALLLPFAASAQMRIDVSGVGATQYPIAIADFAFEGRGQNVAEVVRSDLVRSGAFRMVDPQAVLTDASRIDYAALRSRGADAVLAGSVVIAAVFMPLSIARFRRRE